jgi:probable rRNA maturation factor
MSLDASVIDEGVRADIEIQHATGAATPPDDEVTAWVAAVLATAPSAEAVARSNAEPAGPGAVCVRFVDDEESAALNAAYRGKEGPTNVLSFPAEIDLPELRVWGDLVIAAPREARDQGKAVADHCAHLVVHGVLHLLGYDHQDAAEADQFEHLERGVLARFGVADPYAAENAT